MLLKNIDKKTTNMVMTILLNKYLLTGIPVVDEALNNSMKLSNVGLATKNLGGYSINSSNGLKA
jgi:hypothetical protein